MQRKIVVGTRGSALALAQTDTIIKLLEGKTKDDFLFETKIVKTEGDDLYRAKNPKPTGKDLFTRAIDLSLARGDIDIAVHSLKDLPVDESGLRGKLEIAALPERGSPFDALISRVKGTKIDELRKSARIGTSSLRRALQLKAYRPDFEVVEIHGNVHTRIKKLHEKDGLDAIVLAEAGLSRVGLAGEIDQVLPKEIMLPAAGQGCLAVTTRSKDKDMKRLVSKIDDATTRACVSAERAFSKEMGGGCNVPIAALGLLGGGKLELEGLAANGGSSIVRSALSGSPRDPERAGKKLGLRIKSLMR